MVPLCKLLSLFEILFKKRENTHLGQMEYRRFESDTKPYLLDGSNHTAHNNSSLPNLDEAFHPSNSPVNNSNSNQPIPVQGFITNGNSTSNHLIGESRNGPIVSCYDTSRYVQNYQPIQMDFGDASGEMNSSNQGIQFMAHENDLPSISPEDSMSQMSMVSNFNQNNQNLYVTESPRIEKPDSTTSYSSVGRNISIDGNSSSQLQQMSVIGYRNNITNGESSLHNSRSSSPMTPPNTVAPETEDASPPGPIYRETAHSIFRSTCVENDHESVNTADVTRPMGLNGNVIQQQSGFPITEGTKKYTLPPRFMGKNSRYF